LRVAALLIREPGMAQAGRSARAAAAVRRPCPCQRRRVHTSRVHRLPLPASMGSGRTWTERGPGVPPWTTKQAPTSLLPLICVPYTDGLGKSLTASQAAAAVRELLGGHALAGLRGSGLAFKAPDDATAAVVDSLRQHALDQLRREQGSASSEPLAPDERYSVAQLALRRRLCALAAGLRQGLVERDAEVKLALLALICAEHVLLYGSSGSGKSILGRRLSKAVAETESCGGVPFFERQLSRFSVPEEILGPASLRALREGGSGDERASAGYLPSATVGFIDHIFNASSGLLNSLLTLLNERTLGARMPAV
jgi:hypothetical protein